MSSRMVFERVRVEARDLLELVLIPGLAVFMPWTLCFRLFRWICFHTTFLYQDTCERALAQAHLRGYAPDPKTWIAMRRLITLIDHADYYLERSRTDAWMRRHLKVDGVWPSSECSSVLCTFHWGAGMWALRHAAAFGLKAHIIMAPARGSHFDGRFIARKYTQLRINAVTSALGCPIIDASISLRPILDFLKNGDQIISVTDVPADQVVSSKEIIILDQVARIPTALLRIAVEKKLPVSIFLTGVNVNNGSRYLSINNIGYIDNLDVLIDIIFSELEKKMRDEPAAWHFWSESERFFIK